MYCFTVFSTSMQVQSRSKLMPAMYYAQNNPVLVRLFTQTVPENYSVSALRSFPV